MQKRLSKSNNINVVANRGAVRCAIYARCASGRIEDSSAAEQISACTEYARKQGWEVAEEFVQTDIGAHGISLTGCKSLMHLFDAARSVPRPFDCVLVADISRLGRSLDRVIKLVNAFHGCGVFVQAARAEFDSRDLHPGAWTAKNLLNCVSQYLRPTGRQCPICGRRQSRPNNSSEERK
jgi:hypothetical protein